MRNYLFHSVCLLLCCFLNITCCYARNISLNGKTDDLNIGNYWMNDYHTNDNRIVYCIDPGSKTPDTDQILYPMDVDKNKTSHDRVVSRFANRLQQDQRRLSKWTAPVYHTQNGIANIISSLHRNTADRLFISRYQRISDRLSEHYAPAKG